MSFNLSCLSKAKGQIYMASNFPQSLSDKVTENLTFHFIKQRKGETSIDPIQRVRCNTEKCFKPEPDPVQI